MLYALVKPLCAGLMRLLLGLEVRGAEHVPRHGPVLLVSNHVSLLDPPLIGGAAPRPLCFLAKEELFRVPLLGRLLRALNARPLRREGADAGALRGALRILGEGRALLVFPEGTRGREGALQEAKAGAGMLAVMSGAPVVPVYVAGTGRVLPRGARLPRLARVRVSFGPPLRFAADPADGRKDRYREAAREMMAAVARLRARGQGGVQTDVTQGAQRARAGDTYQGGRG